MKTKVLMAILSILVAASVHAGEPGRIGTFRPAAAISFTAGLSDVHNSYGLALGGHMSLAKFGFVRFPVVGADVGFAYICDPSADTVVGGAHDPCGNRHAGLLQVRGGAEFIVNRSAANNGRGMSFEETSLLITPTYVVAGPLRGNWGLSFGISRRWGGYRFRD